MVCGCVYVCVCVYVATDTFLLLLWRWLLQLRLWLRQRRIHCVGLCLLRLLRLVDRCFVLRRQLL